MNSLEKLKQSISVYADLIKVNEKLKHLFLSMNNDETNEFVSSSNDISSFEEIVECELLKIEGKLDKYSDKKEYLFLDGQEKEIANELVINHPESLLNMNMIDLDSRSSKKQIEMDHRMKYLNEIVKYMANEYDISELNGIEFDEFCRELMEMRIPFKMDIMNRICNGFNEYGVGWKNRCLNVNNNTSRIFFNRMKELKLGQLTYNNEHNRIELLINSFTPSAAEVLNDFEYYLKAPSTYTKNDNLKIDDIISLFYEIGIDISTELVENYLLNYTCSFFFYGSKVLENSNYDSILRRWLGNHYKWKLIYRASEHGYTAVSFHECCDDKGPTLVIIKSSEGWIFGGYTTQSWKYKEKQNNGYYYDDDLDRDISVVDDPEAFIFTLKNPHGVKPTQFKRDQAGECSIYTDPEAGPIFGLDIVIGDMCNEENSCIIGKLSHLQYECHPQYKSSLFVKTNGPHEINLFSVLDYEVYCIDYDSICTINRLCKCPNIIWKYINTNDISEECLKQLDDDTPLLTGLNAIHCKDSNIRLKISKACLKNPSKLLPNTQLVDEQYDSKLKEWIGSNYKWRLLFRASEHEDRDVSFHKYCDDKYPTLVIIKSSEGWIFGGYTTQSWKYNKEDDSIIDDFDDYDDYSYFHDHQSKNDDKAFIFTLKNPHGVEPTRYLKRKKSNVSISTGPYCGLIFGSYWDSDICVVNNIRKKTCIWNDGTHGYECHPQYKSSLYVNTAGPDEKNYFELLDYEIYSVENYKDFVYNICKHPDIIWNYIETKDISEESLKQFDDETELLNDLDAIHCNDSSMKVKISHYYLKSPSELLPETCIVDKKYDSYLREWCGDYKWRLIYRASDHDYTAKSFHKCCNDIGPTLIVIKSSEGWIFGGYTTQLWKIVHPDKFGGIYYDMIH